MRCADKVNVALAAVSALIWVRHRELGACSIEDPHMDHHHRPLQAMVPVAPSHHSLHHSGGKKPLGSAAHRPIDVNFICSTQSLHLFCIVPLVQSSQGSRKYNVCLLSCLALKLNISFAASQL